MGCSDVIVLQRLLDGDLDGAQAELVSHHVESCARCHSLLQDVSAARAFVQSELGAEDEGEEENAAASLVSIAARLPRPPTPQKAAPPWWRQTWLATAAVAVLALLLPLTLGSRAGASAEEILQEVVERERIWVYQPNKVLHWEVETDSTNIRGLANGRWRTLFSQKNGATTFAQISRQYDPHGRTEHAYWQKPDGSTVSYRAKERVVEVWPSTAVLRQAMPGLTPDLRGALESFLQRRETTRALDVGSRREAEWLHRPSAGIAGATATLRRGVIERWGETYHIRIVKDRVNPASDILRAVHEYDVETTTFRRLRLKTTLTYADGAVGTHDSRWTVFRETSAVAFDEQTPRELLESGVPIVRLAPLDVARRRLQELNRERNRTN